MAISWKTKQALLNCVAKGSIAHKASLLSGTNLLIGQEAIDVPPQKTVEVDGADPTRDTNQRKVFFDGKNFFIVYWDLGDKKVYYVASSDGISWTSRTEIWDFNVAPYYGGNVDISYPNRGAKTAAGKAVDLAMFFTGSNGGASQWRPFTISEQILTEETGGALASTKAQGGTIVSSLNGLFDYLMFHRDVYIGLQRNPANLDDTDNTVSHGDTTTGGNQLLPYKTSSPYEMLALCKDASDKLHYSLVSITDGVTSFDGFSELVTLVTGFSDFCACSKAQNIGSPEIVHLVYIKSTGELCYRKFENDVWSGETTLVASGATYPVIAAGKGGKLYVFYVKNSVIKLLKYNGTWGTEATLFSEHTYNNPTYLSSNQNVQNGQICLVWAEGTSTPYEVWFCTMGD